MKEECYGGCVEIEEGMRQKMRFDGRQDGWEMKQDRMWESCEVR